MLNEQQREVNALRLTIREICKELEEVRDERDQLKEELGAVRLTLESIKQDVDLQADILRRPVLSQSEIDALLSSKTYNDRGFLE
jgi:predicted  nucleic acid-binding Zn-ribbon protein